MAITKKDTENLLVAFSKVFATKEDLEKLKDEFATKEELMSVRNELKNDILSSQDKIMKKLEDMSIEQKMAYSQHRRHDEQLENHEKRIRQLEGAASK